MKHHLRFLLLLVSAALSLAAMAYDVRVAGIYYNLDTETKTAEVTRGDVRYSGAVSIPDNITKDEVTYTVTRIGDYTFYWCTSLVSVDIPHTVTSIGEYAFDGSYTLVELTVDGDNPVYDSRGNCNAVIESATNKLVVGCKATTIPNTVTCIGEGAFADCISLEYINIPNSVTRIEANAFFDCLSLRSIYIPSSVYSMVSCFDACTSLESIVVDPENYDYDSRENCNAVIHTQTNQLVQGCKNTVIPNSVTSIGAAAFFGHSTLTSITIPNSVTTIWWQAFRGCKALTSVNIPSSVKNMEWYAFAGCTSLMSATIGDGLACLTEGTFEGCSSLKSVTIGNSVECIDEGAFRGCTSLETLKCKAGNPPVCGTDVFAEVPTEDATLYVPESSIAAYTTAEPWNAFETIKALREEASGIAVVASDAASETPAPVYNLNGQRVAHPGRGVYIIGGKVVLVK